MADTEDNTEQVSPVTSVDTTSEVDPTRTDAERALVTQWIGRVRKAKSHHAKTFKQMRTNMDLARLGASKAWAGSGKYTVPILARHINQAVATLYAKNPTVKAERRNRLMYRLWDGRSDSLQAAMELVQMGLPDPQSMAILQEVIEVQQRNQMLDKMAETVQLLWHYFLDEQDKDYKQQIKAAVRRAKICKVAWIKLGYQRQTELRPDHESGIADAANKMANIENWIRKAQAGEIDVDDARMHQLQTSLDDLQRRAIAIRREGIVLTFPKSDQIIIDPACYHLKSLAGAGWVAEEFEMTPDDIWKCYQVDVGQNFTWYSSDGNPYDKDPKDCTARVYQIWDKENGQVCTVCEGYPEFLEQPAAPEPNIERFWPYFPIVFNEVEHYEEIYPQSDVEHGEHIQNEYNRSREALREHRIAARPYYVTGVGLEDEEKAKLAQHAAHAVITMPTLGSGQKIEEVLQRGPVANVDPNLYEVEMIFQDLLRSVGTQEANLGGLGGGTATENSIAEGSRSSAHGENVDDLDSVLSQVVRAGSQMMLMIMAKATVVQIVGPGAVWPDMPQSREEAVRDLDLKIEAGSSGRPNKGAELANMERAVPYMIQLPGLNPMAIGKRYGELLDLDLQELVAESVPSVTAINAAMAKMGMMGGAGVPGGGAPATGGPGDPNAQGPAGGQNAPSPQQNEPGPQAAYPQPMA